MEIYLDEIQTKQSGYSSSGLGDMFSWIGDRIAGLFRSAEEPSPYGEPAASGPAAMQIMRELVGLEQRLGEAKRKYDEITQRADTVSAQMADITAAINTITSNLSTRYASNTAAALAARISERAQEWDHLNAQAAALAQDVINLQREVDTKERELGAKSARSAYDLYR